MTLLLKNFVQQNWSNAYQWLDEYAKRISKNASNIYNSCDIRYSGFKIANVDCNLFPAGFKNVNASGLERCKAELLNFINDKKSIGLLKNDAKNIILIGESHTRNIPYLHGLSMLKDLFEAAGFEMRLATFNLKKFKVKFGENAIEVYRLIKKDGKLALECELWHNQNQALNPASDGEVIFQDCNENEDKIKQQLNKQKVLFKADFLVINNDMTAQSPDILNEVDILTFPKTDLGWHKRKKSSHFTKYKQVVGEFCKEFDIDPWFFSAIFDSCDGVDIKEGVGLDDMRSKVEKVQQLTQEKYRQYGIKNDAKVYIKANAGTYGMGVMMLSDASEIAKLNKDARSKLDSIKSGIKSTSFLIQEGVPSAINVNNSPSELVSYGFNLTPCDFFYRYHADKDANNSLNAPGARFENKNDFQDIFSDGENSIQLKLSYIAAKLAYIACGLE